MRAWDRSRLPFRLAASPIFSVFIRELALTEEGRGIHEHGGSGQRSPLSSAPPGAGGWDRRLGPVAGTAGQARWAAPGSPVSPRPCRLSWPFQNPGHGDLSCWSQRSVHADVLFGVETSAFCF